MDAPATVTAALALGAAGSLHCFVMCGPLACAAQGATSRRRAAIAYHVARVAGYAAVGAGLGAAGHMLPISLGRALPWLLAAVLVAAVIDPGARRLRRLPPLPGIAQFLRFVAGARAKLSPTAQAVLMGGVTPLLPCGLVYGIGAAAVATSSAAGGASLMGAFALGAVPALTLAQLSSGALRRLPRVPALVVERGLPLAAAAVLIYRAVAATGATHACH